MSLLLDMAREAVLAKVARRVKSLSRGYVEGWIRGDFSIVDHMARKHKKEIRAWRDVVLGTMDSLTVDELLKACHEARPDFRDLWESEGARRRLTEEWSKAHAYVKGL